MREGNKLEALRHLDGASGPLARRFAPLPGDDAIDRAEQIDAMRGKIGTAKEQGTFQAELLKELEERGDKEGAKRLREAMEANTRSVKALEEALGRLTGQGGATVQQQSFSGSAGIGAMIQQAALRGGGGSGGGYGGGTLGERLFGQPTGANALGDPYRQQRMDALKADPSAEWRLRIGLGERNVPLPGGGSTSARGSLATNQQEAYAAARAEGLSDTAARALVANMSGESLRNPRDHHWDRLHMSQGIVQWDPQRAERIRQRFGAYPKDMSVTDQTRAAIDEMKTRPEYAPTWRALQGDQPGSMLDALVRNYERPKFKERAIAERSAFYRGFSPKPFGTADGAGFSTDFKARQAAEEERRSGLKLGSGAQGALQAGAGAGGSVTADGRVNIAVETKDPDTRVRTSASGNLFREIVQSRGRQMQPAD